MRTILPIPYLEEKTKAQKDLAQWRALLDSQVQAKKPQVQRPKMHDPGSRASNRYLNLITAGWTFPKEPIPLIHWSQ